MSDINTNTQEVRTIETVPNTYVRIDMPANINLLVGNQAAAGWEQLEKQYKIMRGEWDELTKNVTERNYAGLVDDVQDLLFTLIGFSHAAGFIKDFSENFHRVSESQFKKFDYNAEDAAKTAAKYESIGVKVVTEVAIVEGVSYYITKSAIEQINPGRNESIPAGKWLKSYKFEEAQLIHPELNAFSPVIDSTPVTEAVVESAEVLTEETDA